MKHGVTAVLTVLAILGAGCRPGPVEAPSEPPFARRTVVWTESGDLGGVDAEALTAAGVDLLAVPVAEVDLSGDIPVVKTLRNEGWPGEIPIALVVRIERMRAGLDPGTAMPVWRVIRGSLAETVVPAEIVLDVPDVTADLAPFVAQLAAESAISVVPLVTPAQLQDPPVLEAVRAAGGCTVLAFGTVETVRPGAELSNLPLEDQLAPLVPLGIRPRVAVVLRPRSVPALGVWGDDLDPLTEPTATDIRTASVLDRTFVFRKAVEWSGRTWKRGDSVALRWMDIPRLDRALHESTNVVLPEVRGWDLVGLPPRGEALGMGREALLAYLEGEGPWPSLEVSVDRKGRNLTVTLKNRSVFPSAVSAYGSWVEVRLGSGALVAKNPGDFDRIVLGTRKGGGWERMRDSRTADAVRFYETYVAPGEEMRSGTVRLPSSRSRATVSWRVVLSTGEELSGTLR